MAVVCLSAILALQGAQCEHSNAAIKAELHRHRLVVLPFPAMEDCAEDKLKYMSEFKEFMLPFDEIHVQYYLTLSTEEGDEYIEEMFDGLIQRCGPHGWNIDPRRVILKLPAGDRTYSVFTSNSSATEIRAKIKRIKAIRPMKGLSLIMQVFHRDLSKSEVCCNS
jgi:hypothetical protein